MASVIPAYAGIHFDVRAAAFDLRLAPSNLEHILLPRLALVVRREARALVREIALAVVTVGRAVVGEIDVAPLVRGEVRLRLMWRVAIEEHDVPGRHRIRLE